MILISFCCLSVLYDDRILILMLKWEKFSIGDYIIFVIYCCIHLFLEARSGNLYGFETDNLSLAPSTWPLSLLMF